MDSIIEAKRKKAEAKKKAEKTAEQRKKECQKKKEIKETGKANLSPQRVFINKTDDGVMVSVHQSPLAAFIRNSFSGDLLISIVIFIFGLTFFIPMTIALMEEFEIILINKVVDTIIILVLCEVLTLIGKIIHSVTTRMKNFHLLLTKKNNILIYRKNPLKPVVMGRKGQLAITIDYTANPPGGSGASTRAWKRITFEIQGHTFKDDGFKYQDADRVQGFCTKNKIKFERY